MAQSRKDSKGRVLRKGESQRKDDKRYIYQYRDPNGKAHVIYANDLPELRRKEEKLIRDQLDGIDQYCEASASVNYVFDRFISTKYDLKENTKANYLYMYNHYVRDTFGNRPIGSIRYSDVKFFYLDLINKCGLKTSTVDTIHTILHPTFEMAVRDEVIRINPTNKVMAEIKKGFGKNKGIRHALTVEQQRAFLNYTLNSPVYDHWYPLFIVMFGTGMRIGEVLGLRWDDIDFDANVISVNHTLIYLSRGRGTTAFKINSPKTEAGKRTIPMLDTVREQLLLLYKEQEEEGFCTINVGGMTNFVFFNRDGGLVNPSLVNRAIRRIYESHNAGEIINAKKEHRQPVIIPHFSNHHARHTFCSRFCDNETNVKLIQTVMGHASIETTMNIYAETSELKKQNAIKILGDENKFF